MLFLLMSLWIKYNKNSYLIQLSTDQVYDGKGLKKEDEITIKNYYSFSKLAGDIVATSVNSVVIRTNFFGKSYKYNRDSFSDWILTSLKNGQSIKAFNDIYFSPLSMETLSGLILCVLKNPIFGIFNVGSKNGFSKADFICKVAQTFNFSNDLIKYVSIKNIRLDASRPTDMRMDNSFFENTYKIELPTLENEIIKLKGDY